MPGTEPYTTTCKFCSKQMIMGINPDTSKWQPWDNYATKEKHNCKSTAQAKQIATIAAGGIPQDNEAIAMIQQRLTTIEQSVSMSNWLLEKVAKKVGVDDLIENQNG